MLGNSNGLNSEQRYWSTNLNWVSGLGSGVATFLGTPSSANLAAALTDEVGTGPAVFASSTVLTAPTFTGVTTLANASSSAGISATNLYATRGQFTNASTTNLTVATNSYLGTVQSGNLEWYSDWSCLRRYWRY